MAPVIDATSVIDLSSVIRTSASEPIHTVIQGKEEFLRQYESLLLVNDDPYPTLFQVIILSVGEYNDLAEEYLTNMHSNSIALYVYLEDTPITDIKIVRCSVNVVKTLKDAMGISQHLFPTNCKL